MATFKLSKAIPQPDLVQGRVEARVTVDMDLGTVSGFVTLADASGEGKASRAWEAPLPPEVYKALLVLAASAASVQGDVEDARKVADDLTAAAVEAEILDLKR